MFRIFSKAVLLALGVSLAFQGVAYAGAERSEDEFRAAGEITSVETGASAFTLHTRAGEDLRIFVDDATRYVSREGEIDGLEDLAPGMYALVQGTQKGENGKMTASLVAVGKPEDARDRVRAAGKVTAVDLAQSQFSIQTREGESLTFQVGDRTEFRSKDGSVNSLEDLKAEMPVLVIALKQDDSTLMALLVVVGSGEGRPELKRFAGTIMGVDSGAGTFTLKTREGEELSFQTNEETRYHSRDGSVQGLEDLQAGMAALVGAKENEDGSLLALAVAVGKPEDRPRPPRPEVKVAGKITAVGGNSLTIETARGESLTFLVDGSTVIKSRDGSIDSFDDLQAGMRVVVGAKESDAGLLAIWIGVGGADSERPNPRPEGRPQELPRGEAPPETPTPEPRSGGAQLDP